MNSVASSGFPREAIEACLDRIAASRHFVRSRRLSRFLRFTVEALLEGRSGELKERTIGVEVYHRALEYDPRLDPIVRSEAHRLRTRLAAYYAAEGSADPIVVDYPKGSYVPGLGPNPSDPEHGLPGCRLVVAGFEDHSPGGRSAAQARAMGDALRSRLAVQPGVRVLYRASGAPGAQHAGSHLDADYRVDGTFDRRDGRCEVTARLARLADGQRVWSQTERFAPRRAAEVPEILAEQLAAAIGATVMRRASPAQPATARAHDLYVKGRHSVMQYGNTLDPRHLEPARRRLRAAIEHEPDYVDALAELANLELMHLYPPRSDASHVLTSARGVLERALAAEPRHARSLYLLGHIAGSTGRHLEALRLTESAVAIDPDDPEGRTMLAVRYTSLGFWESAVAACDWALALDPVWDAPHRIKAYLLTRMGRPEDTRIAIADLANHGTSPPEVAMARFDLLIAEGRFASARAELESAESTFPLRPDLEDRREIALALARALEGSHRDARRTLESHRSDGFRFWDHTIRLALVLGEGDLARELFLGNPINGSYRWLATEELARSHLRCPGWQAVVEERHERWQRDLATVGPRLPAAPPSLPKPADLLQAGSRAPARSASASPARRPRDAHPAPGRLGRAHPSGRQP